MELTLARLRELLEYDPDTGVFRWKVNMPPRGIAGAVAGTVCKTGYRYIAINGERFLAHRLAWFYVNGDWPLKNLDHINGRPGDNRIANLREATQSQNLANIAPHRDSVTGLKGVSRKRDKFEARIFARGRSHRLGVFPTPQEAHAAYCSAARKLHGEFARTS